MRRLKEFLQANPSIQPGMFEQYRKDIAADLQEIKDKAALTEYTTLLLELSKKSASLLTDQEMTLLNNKENSFKSPQEISNQLWGLVRYDTNLSQVQDLVKNQGADVNIASRSGDATPLSEAIRCESWQIAEWLANNGASVVKPDDLLQGIAEKGPLNLFKMLVEKGAPLGPKCINAVFNRRDRKHIEFLNYIINEKSVKPTNEGNGYTPTLHAALSAGKEVVELLLDNGLNVDFTDSNGNTALHKEAASYQSIQVLQLLAERGANPNQTNSRGATPVMVVINQHGNGHNDNYIDYLRALAKSKQKLQFPPLTIDQQYNLLCSAMVRPISQITTKESALADMAKSFETIAPGLSLIDTNLCSEDNHKRTLLHRAIWNRKWDMAYYLASIGADLEAEDNQGRKPYQLVDVGYQDNVKADLEKFQKASGKVPQQPSATPAASATLAIPAAISAATTTSRSMGKTVPPAPVIAPALQRERLNESLIAWAYNSLAKSDDLDTLVRQGADVNYREKQTQSSVLYFATLRKNDADILKLIEFGANVDDRAALEIVVSLNKRDLLQKMFAKGAKKYSSLINEAMDSICVNSDGVRNLLTLGVTPEDQPTYVDDEYDSVEDEYDSVTDQIKKKTKLKKPTLQQACKYEDKDCLDLMRLFVQKGLNVNHRDVSTGRTALHEAVLLGRLQSVQFLLEQNVSINSEDNDRRMPLDCLFIKSSARSQISDSDRFNIALALMKKGAKADHLQSVHRDLLIQLARQANCQPMLQWLGADVAPAAAPVSVVATTATPAAAASPAVDEAARIKQLNDKLVAWAKNRDADPNALDEMVAQGANVNYRSGPSNTSIMAHVLSGILPNPMATDLLDTDMAFKLLKYDVKLDDDEYYLNRAAFLGNRSLIEALVAKKAKLSPFIFLDTVRHGHELVQYFLDLGIKPVNQCSNQRQLKNKQTQAMETHTEYYTPTLQIVGHNDTATMKLLLAAGLDVNYRDVKKGQTVLHHAVDAGSEKMVAFLLERNAEIDIKDSEGCYPLDYLFPPKCATEILYKIARLLIMKGASFDQIGIAHRQLLLSHAKNNADQEMINRLEKRAAAAKLANASSTCGDANKAEAKEDRKPLLADERSAISNMTPPDANKVIQRIQSNINAKIVTVSKEKAQESDKSKQAEKQRKVEALEALKAAITEVSHDDKLESVFLSDLEKLVHEVLATGNRQAKLEQIEDFEGKYVDTWGRAIAGIIFGLVGAVLGAALGFAAGMLIGGGIGPQAVAAGLFGLAKGSYTGWAVATAATIGGLSLAGGIVGLVSYLGFFASTPRSEVADSAQAVVDAEEITNTLTI